MKLPVYRIASTVAPADQIRDIGRRIFPRDDYQIVERGTLLELRSRYGTVEIDIGRGGVWASDASKLWRPDPSSRKERNLITGLDAEKLGLELLKSHAVLPTIEAPFRLKQPRSTGSKTAYSPKNGARQIIQEDTTILAEIEVDVREYDLKQKALPVVGGGGRFGVVFGDGGSPLAIRGVWRPAVGKPTLHELIAPTKADEIYRGLMKRVPVAEFSADLAYYSAPAFSGQELLYPVYVYSGVADYQGKRVPLRKVLIPATEIGPPARKPAAQTPRTKSDRSRVRPLPGDFKPQPGKPLPPGIGVNLGRLRAEKLNLDDLFVKGPFGSPLIVRPDLKLPSLEKLLELLGFFAAGTSWIGLSGGLGGSQNNARGFVDELAAVGWDIQFNWGDGNAWESDWRQNDDDWVDQADFVFYTGHANSDGWVLSAPDDDFLHFTETAGARDLWGDNLEWVVVAACGPLQDEVVGSGGDVLDRWKNAFDGLHMLMGYAQVTYDNEEEGRRLAQYAKTGSTIMQSWFRTGQEIQPEGIWVGAYYLGGPGGSTGNDHLWGVGSVGPDILNPTWRACTWVPC